jgi:hypothetical protein
MEFESNFELFDPVGKVAIQADDVAVVSQPMQITLIAANVPSEIGCRDEVCADAIFFFFFVFFFLVCFFVFLFFFAPNVPGRRFRYSE